MFNFQITAKAEKGSARRGVFSTSHGDIQTPVFMPVGTKATVKTQSVDNLKSIGSQIILANAYHLFLRPGEDLVAKMGGLHKWTNWDRPILTDSGGFQVFSLGQEKGFHKNNPNKTTIKIDDNGVEFKSFLDGSLHYITPESSMEIQHKLGADIIMAFDECAPANSSKEYLTSAMERTHKWAHRCKKAHLKLLKDQNHQQALFPIVQGGAQQDLRAQSADFINSLDLHGNAIGGLSVGEGKEIMYESIETVNKYLSKEKPRYLMGVGTPEDLLESVDRGIDMFDCVHPTRMGRHGSYWNLDGRHGIKKAINKDDQNPLQENCQCYTCQNHSRSYLRHLITENETLGLQLMSTHNLHFLLQLMRDVRESITNQSFSTFKANFLKRFFSNK